MNGVRCQISNLFLWCTGMLKRVFLMTSLQPPILQKWWRLLWCSCSTPMISIVSSSFILIPSLQPSSRKLWRFPWCNHSKPIAWLKPSSFPVMTSVLSPQLDSRTIIIDRFQKNVSWYQTSNLLFPSWTSGHTMTITALLPSSFLLLTSFHVDSQKQWRKYLVADVDNTITAEKSSSIDDDPDRVFLVQLVLWSVKVLNWEK